MKRLSYVDALRGIAIMLVVLVHSNASLPAGTISALSPFGQFGVQLFFLMSAFTLSVANHEMGLNQQDYRAFLIKRFFRIAPLYYLAVVGYYVFSLISERLSGQTPFNPTSQYTLVKVFANFTFLHSFYPDANNSIVPGGWSIACEFLFYAFFPFMFVISKKWRVGFLLIALPSFLGLGLLLLAARWAGHLGEGGNNSFPFYSLANQMPVFLLGILLYHFHTNLNYRRVMELAATPSAVALFYVHDAKWGWMLTPLLAGIAFTGLALVVENRIQGGWLCWVGELSYSIYLSHFAVAWILVPYIQRLSAVLSPEILSVLSFVCVLSISIAISAFLHRYIELYFIALGKQLLLRLKPDLSANVLERTPEWK